MRQKKSAYLVVILAAAVAVTATTVRAWRDGKGQPEMAIAAEPRPLPAAAVAQAVTPPGDAGLIRRGMLASPLHAAFQALGNRLERPGSERLTMTGALQHGGDAQATPFALVWEVPGRVRLTEQRATGPRVLVFDGQEVTSSVGPVDRRDLATLELLVFDAVEHFFLAQAEGASAIRFLGSRFRLHGDEANPPCDLFEITEAVGFPGEAREQTRTYHFDSDTHLLDRLSYRDERTGSEGVVRFGDWRLVAGQQIAHRVERLENDTPALTLWLNAVAVGPRLADGIFTPLR